MVHGMVHLRPGGATQSRRSGRPSWIHVLKGPTPHHVRQGDTTWIACSDGVAAGWHWMPIALLHAADGDLFEEALVEGASSAGHAGVRIAQSTTSIHPVVDALGKAVGPPWQKDHKVAAMAALMLLRCAKLATQSSLPRIFGSRRVTRDPAIESGDVLGRPRALRPAGTSAEKQSVVVHEAKQVSVWI